MSYDKKSKKIYAPCDKLPEAFGSGVLDDDLEKELEALALLLMNGWTCVVPGGSLPKWRRTKPERGVAFGWGLSKSPERGHVVFIKGYELSIDEAWEKLEKEPETDMELTYPGKFVRPEDCLRKAASDLVAAVESYVEPRPGEKYMHRTKVLAIKNKLKEMLK